MPKCSTYVLSVAKTSKAFSDSAKHIQTRPEASSIATWRQQVGPRWKPLANAGRPIAGCELTSYIPAASPQRFQTSARTNSG